MCCTNYCFFHFHQHCIIGLSIIIKIVSSSVTSLFLLLGLLLPSLPQYHCFTVSFDYHPRISHFHHSKYKENNSNILLKMMGSHYNITETCNHQELDGGGNMISTIINNDDINCNRHKIMSNHDDIINHVREDMNMLHHRLQACNVTNYCFVNNNDNTIQYSPTKSTSSSSVSSQLQRTLLFNDATKSLFKNAVHVKTLIWMGNYLKSNKCSAAGSDKINGDNNYDQHSNNPFYFVTALRSQDKVDMKTLRALVKRQWPPIKNKNSLSGNSISNGGGMLILQLAEQCIAEELTGFRSGSMPPGWHSYPLPLFIDDNIIEDANKLIPSSSTNYSLKANDSNIIINDETFQPKYINNESLSHVIVSLGSGAEDYSLHVPLIDLLNSSIYYNNLQEKSNILLSEYNNICNGKVKRQIYSFSNARIEQINRYLAEQKQNGEMKESVMSVVQQATKVRSNLEILTKDLNRKAFNIAARKKGKTLEVKRMIELMGNKFCTFMKVEFPTGENRFAGEFNKNALHYAAWKGDLETITLLINTSKNYEELGDIVNTISTGEGNYGKTAIFYAITQCRDDAVLLLLSHGANLLIVNNKGQSPCSLAVNKLKKETCDFMFQVESNQLEAGGKFCDYRESHSDGQRYGDLDPRFIRVGDINFDEDILKEMGFSNTLPNVSNLDLNKLSLPRSVRVTDALMRQLKWSRHENPINATDKKEKESKFYAVTMKDKKSEIENDSSTVKIESNQLQRDANYKTAKTITKNEDGTEVDIMSLPTLFLRDTLSLDGSQTSYELIDDEAGLFVLRFAVDEVLSQLSQLESVDDDSTIMKKAWGLDCEWRPSTISGEENPVSILQLSTGSRAFVVDVQSLLQHRIKQESTEMTKNEIMLSGILSQLFMNPNITILGFGIGQDLTKLAASFPHIPCFREYHSVLDLQTLSRQLYPGMPKQLMGSLQKAVAVLLKKKLDKTEQCSEWDIRPLRESQLQYASLDAAILPQLLMKMTHCNKIFDSENGFFLKKHSYLQTSYRFQIISSECNSTYIIPMGSMKSSLQVKFARQIWPTFKQKPSLPEMIPVHQQALKVKSREMSNKTKEIQEKKKWTKKNPISVTVLTGDLANLPPPGILLGYTKESVIERIVRKQVIESLPENFYLQYNRRGGIIELGNTFLLFVNFGVGRVHHKYRNEFLNNGRQVTFTINQSRYEDIELLQTLITPQDEAMYYRKSVLFFIRASTKDKFMFCGKANYCEHMEKDDDLVDLVLELSDFDKLVQCSKNTDGDDMTYTKIVSSQYSF